MRDRRHPAAPGGRGGAPYEAFAVDETLTVRTTLWGGKQVFALRVRGDSMIDEGIHSGGG